MQLLYGRSRGTLEEGRWIQRRLAGHSGNPLDAETIRVDIEMMERIRRRASRYIDDRKGGRGHRINELLGLELGLETRFWDGVYFRGAFTEPGGLEHFALHVIEDVRL
jgi:hypothetical protein